ncbi:D-glycero-beta-D-manno-heptose 1,7-bisphosphate 7-phosphatase [Candidatus Curculioniphilus buchneri]|uniref:D-glycero-beta-D-manno-heptose 1,7-bisphosphate 7-phosphatase n=1 Tax=Candidatus Curculioniphilus buchneri TaxID=690594 RepID=UPI00376EEBBE
MIVPFPISAIFLDRDGTINVDASYVCKIENFYFIDGVIEAMQEFKRLGFALIVVTNQSGLSRGFFNEDEFMNLMKWMSWSLENYNVYLDGIYFCPHHPNGVIKNLRSKCNCRKPKPGMLLAAQRDLNINMSSSYMIGDKLDDILAGRAAKIGTSVLVRSNKPITQEANAAADLIIDNLAVLLTVIKQRSLKSVNK